MPITDPTDIAGLVFWGDAVVITENPTGFAEIMDNQEGTASEDISQPTVGDRPSIVTVFGKKGLQFDGAVPADHLVGGVAAPVAGTLVFVLRLPPAVSDFDAVMWYGGTAIVSTVPAIWKDDDDVRFMVGRGNISGIAFSASPDSDWTWGDDVMVTLTWDGATDAMTLRINKIAKGSGSAGLLGAMSGMCVGARGDGGLGSNVNAYGLVVYNSILTGANLTDIEDFMMTTYLPVNVITADAGQDETVTAEEDNTATVSLDGRNSFGPLAITNYEWKEGTTVLASGIEATPAVVLSEGVHNITLTVTDSNNDTDTDTVVWTVNAFVPPTPPPIRTFKQITGSTDKVHTFNDVFPLTPETVAPSFTKFHNQLRVFKKDVANVVTELFPVGRASTTETTDFTIDTAGTQITLDTALVATDTLVIMRETQMNRPFVVLINVARLHGRDRNVRGDQILFIAQELREIRLIADILGSGAGEPFEYDPEPIDQSNWTQTHLGDGVTTIFSFSNIEMLPVEAVRYTPELTILINNVVQTTGFTVSESALTVTFDVAPADVDTIEIRRITRIDKLWITFRDGSTFSSLENTWDFLNVKFIIEETPNFPTFLLPNPLENRIFPRPLNTITYSGPGDRFFFGNLPWFGDGTVFIFKNDLLLTEIVDYTLNFIFFFIDLTVPLVAGDTLQVITTTPNHAFGALGFKTPGGTESSSDDSASEPVGVTELRGDVTLFAGFPSNNFGTSKNLALNDQFTTDNLEETVCMEFDVTQLDPADFTTIHIVFFVLYSRPHQGFSMKMRRCLRLWDMNTPGVSPSDGTLTWLQAKTGLSWTLPGARGADTDYDSASEVSWSVGANQPVAENEWITPDLSALVTAARADDGILRLILFAKNTDDDFHMKVLVASLERDFPSKRPRLEGN